MGLRRILQVIVAVAAAGMVFVLDAAPASATWSIVATDPETGDVGVAIASCVPAEVLGPPDQPLVPVVLVPGRAAAVTQGQLNLDAPGRITDLIAAGASAAEIVADLASPAFDEQAELRQHAVVGVDGSTAAHTGAETLAEALDRQGNAVSVQGNLLATPQVVADTAQQFLADRSEGAELAPALAAALLAGSQAGGDRRCGDQTALFAQVVVAAPGDDAAAPAVLVTVLVDEHDGQNPVEALVPSLASGEWGAVDLRTSERSGWLGRGGVLVAGLALAGVGFAVFRRGLGSRLARR